MLIPSAKAAVAMPNKMFSIVSTKSNKLPERGYMFNPMKTRMLAIKIGIAAINIFSGPFLSANLPHFFTTKVYVSHCSNVSSKMVDIGIFKFLSIKTVKNGVM